LCGFGTIRALFHHANASLSNPGVAELEPSFAASAVPEAPTCSGSATTIACMATTISNFVPSAALYLLI
jgi:hypothetical protein